jgi:hypothetical protein
LFAACGATASTMSLSHASCNVVAMRDSDDEQTSMKLLQTVENEDLGKQQMYEKDRCGKVIYF